MTHERWARPPSSPTMVGRAVATMVESSAASSMARIRPLKTIRTCRAGRGPGVVVVVLSGIYSSVTRSAPGRGTARYDAGRSVAKGDAMMGPRSRTVRAAALAAAFLAGPPRVRSADPRPPATRTGDVVDTVQGVSIADPYRWL